MFKSNVASFDVSRSLVFSVAKLSSGALVAGGGTCCQSPNGLYGTVCPMNEPEAGLKIASLAFRICSNRSGATPWNRAICSIWLYINAPS